jgi:hypothetical protein
MVPYFQPYAPQVYYIPSVPPTLSDIEMQPMPPKSSSQDATKKSDTLPKASPQQFQQCREHSQTS